MQRALRVQTLQVSFDKMLIFTSKYPRAVSQVLHCAEGLACTNTGLSYKNQENVMDNSYPA